MPLLISPCELNDGYLLDENYKNLIFHKFNHQLIDINENLKIKSASDQKYFYLRLDNNLNKELSILRLQKKILNNKEYYLVNKAHSFKQGQGYARILYETAFLYLDLPILSDSINTKRGSSDLWMKLQKRQDDYGYEILIFNTQTNHKGKFISRNYNEYDIWGWHLDFLNMAKSDPTFLEVSLAEGDMDIGLFNFLTKKINKVKDRTHIRLIGKKIVNTMKKKAACTKSKR